MWKYTTLEDSTFSTINGLWTGKSEPFVSAKVLRNTNFRNDGVLDYSNVATLDVESKSLSKKRLNKGDIIIERSGGGPKQPVGRVCLFDLDTTEPFSLSNFTTALRILDSSRFLPRFVCYYLLYLYRTGYTEALQRATTGIRNLDFSAYLRTEIPEPPINEQRTISSILWRIQQAIEVETNLIRVTRELKAAVMKKLFTEGLYGEPQKETEIGMVPESWELRRLGSVAKFQGGYAFKSGSYVNKGVRLLRISNVSFGHADWTDTAFLPESMLQEYEDYSLKTDDIVMAMTRPVVSGGIKVATLQSTDVPALLNQRVGRFRCSREVVDRFLYQLVFTDNFVASINTYADGSQQPNISAGQIESIMIPLPRSTDEQIEIAKRLDLIDADLEIHSNKRRLLQDLFQSALSMLMSGKGVISNLKVETPCLDSQEFAA